jgi:lipopolysaccharide export LptBFGC system permease protein LptF
LEHRQAYPWICFVAVLLAGPFAIVYSRRAILSGIALAVGLFSSIFFLNEFFLVLGKGMHLSPVVAAWTPAVALGIVGWIALFFRNSNRELPQLFAKRR